MLDDHIQYLKGVGPHKAKILSRLGIVTVRELLNYFPREYDDRRTFTRIAQLCAGSRATISGKVEAADSLVLNRSLSLFKVAVSDGSGIAFGLFYRKMNPYHRHDVFGSLKKIFIPGNRVILNGTVEINFGEKQIKTDDYESCETQGNSLPFPFGRIVPVYPLTEGVRQKWLRELMKAALEKYSDEWPDPVPGGAAGRSRFKAAAEALRHIHFPPDFSAAQEARNRLAFDEFLLLETALSLARRKIKVRSKPRRYEIKKDLLTPFREHLNFEFTPAQKKVIKEIFTDLQTTEPMNRLLMGDVGSGKTVVAVSSMLLAIENGFQAALLAPTEILAEQHYLTLQKLLSGLPVRTGLLTGRLSAKRKEKKKLLEEAAAGGIDLLVGTHALLEKNIVFRNLALIVIDEQHRFGVLQRAALREKGEHADVLIMTATPIPRTLALTLYGDTDVSVIDRLPPGRKPVQTLHLDEPAAYELVKREVRSGHQAYIVYPLVEESDKVELKAAVREAEHLSASVFNGFRVGLLHGQMGAEEKEKVMLEFRAGGYDILISTTVIEVGIDVPNATAMVIEHADRFGLATLHQLRGRIGRGPAASSCVLCGSPKTDDARKRIDVMLSTTDGFVIAEEDLTLRGPGEFFGTAQHGMPVLKAGNLVTDTALIEEAKERSRGIVEKDPALSAPGNASLRAELLRAFRGRFGLFKIG
ncbi:MAG: ATP-dependent DNA helicase RecG [Endomicrobiales bacterium]